MGGWNLPDDVPDNHPIFGRAGEPDFNVDEFDQARTEVREAWETLVANEDFIMNTEQFARKDIQNRIEKIEGIVEEMDSTHGLLQDAGWL